jgi:hypothetical protein
VAGRNGPSGLYDEPYMVNNVLGTEPIYIGKATGKGTWLVQKYSPSAGTMDYANYSNNNSITDYATAWTGRVALTYAAFETLTGV